MNLDKNFLPEKMNNQMDKFLYKLHFHKHLKYQIK